MGCKNTKCKKEVIDRDTKRNMFSAGFNMGEQTYGIQFGLATTEIKNYKPVKTISNGEDTESHSDELAASNEK
jgi:hypothetical protein